MMFIMKIREEYILEIYSVQELITSCLPSETLKHYFCQLFCMPAWCFVLTEHKLQTF
jgi:hypothetical protein